MKPSPEQRSFRVSPKAFTLVETAMALGIVAFAFTGLMGVLPLALTELGNARNNVVVAELAESYLAKASQTDFTALQAKFGGGQVESKWHDVSGIETTPGGAAYKVVTSATNSSLYSQTIVVEVYRQPGQEAAKPLAEFVAIVSDNGR